MNATQFDGTLTGRNIRNLSRGEIIAIPLQPGGSAQAGATSDASGKSAYSKALMVLKGSLIVSAVVFVTITLALQTAARFS